MASNYKLLYNYFGLELQFNTGDPEPLAIYCKRDQRISRAIILFEKGIFNGLRLSNISDAGLDAEDQKRFELLINTYLPEICKHWIDFFVYKIPVKSEILMKKIESNPDSIVGL